MHHSIRRAAGLAVFFAFASGAFAQTIDQARGADSRVDYRALTRFGPWDDRNYTISTEDLAYLAPNEAELIIPIPVFFRIELRKRFPDMPRKGTVQYPRASVPLFRRLYDGLLVDGRFVWRENEAAERSTPVVGSEVKLNQLVNRDEVTVEINPVTPLKVIAGANGNAGQEMYYSNDGGATWTVAGVLPNTCCDPTVAWSSDGTIAYAASLSSGLGVNFYRSTNFGQSWGTPLAITPNGSDKEFVHVDISPASPFKDNVYVTWHDFNVMQLGRSTNLGLNFTITTFGSAPSGIGSDITTDIAGNVYYTYASFSAQQVILLKSTDGGATFGPHSAIGNTNGSFDFPIPAMESRRAWIYASCDADRSAGPFSGSIYVAWTDTTAAESEIAANNHTQVKVAYSRNGGANWTTVIPHPTADVNTVDRFNQWITVDENGYVYVVFYDTRNSANRTGVDLYYTLSEDGGVTWLDPVRISSQTSANLTDGQEWGDYNGLSVVGGNALPAWTDNRSGPPNDKNVYVADVANLSAPGFDLAANPDTKAVCRPGATAFALEVTSLLGFNTPVTLSVIGAPPGVSVTFTQNPVTPGNQTTANVMVSAGASLGNGTITVKGVASGAEDKQIDLIINVMDPVAGLPNLLSPVDGELRAGYPTVPLAWSTAGNVTAYRVQVSASIGFAATIVDTTTANTTLNVTVPAYNSTYYWRVAALSTCGEGSFTSPFSFVSDTNEFTSTDVPKSIPDNNLTGITSIITVPTGFILSDVNAKVNITHTWDSDLRVRLRSPSGAEILLFDNVGGSGENFTNTVLDDEAATSITAAIAPCTGSFRPEEVLSAFDGQNAQGNWTLTLIDMAGADTGTLNSWSITLAGAPPGPAVVWVQFSFAGTETGSESQPFNTMAEAVAAAGAGDTIRIKTGASVETPRITKQLRVEASGGTARIGAL